MAISQVQAYAYSRITAPGTQATIVAGGQNSASNAEQRGLTSAALATLQQAGIGNAGTNSRSNATPTSVAAIDPFQAISSFIRDLYAALKAQADSGSADTASAPPSSKASAAYGEAGLTSRLQQLIGQLASPAANQNPSVAGLQQAFSQVLSQSGVSANSTNLPSFLQALAHNIVSSGSVGSVLNVKA